jgi:hypothetical protein
VIDSNDEVDVTEDEDWDRMTEAEFFRGYAETDSIYDEFDESPSEE